MDNGFKHVVWVSAVLGIVAFVYVVGFAPMDESASPRAAAIDRQPPRTTVIASIRRSMAQGQLTAADRAADLLVEHNPEDPSAYFYRALVYRQMGQDESAISYWAMLDGILASLTSWTERYNPAELDYFRAWAKLGIGDLDGSVAMFTKIADDLEARSVNSDLDDEDGSADSEMQVPVTTSRAYRAGVHYNLACYRAMAGDLMSARAHWELAVTQGYGVDDGWWSVDPDLESLHTDEQFWTVGRALGPVWTQEPTEESLEP